MSEANRIAGLEADKRRLEWIIKTLSVFGSLGLQGRVWDEHYAWDRCAIDKAMKVAK